MHTLMVINAFWHVKRGKVSAVIDYWSKCFVQWLCVKVWVQQLTLLTIGQNLSTVGGLTKGKQG